MPGSFLAAPKIRKRQRPCGPWRSPDDLLAQWIMHRPVLPADEAASCPASCILLLCPGCVSGFPRTVLPLCQAGVRRFGLPLGFRLRLCRRWSVRVAPNFACLRRCWFRQGSGFPRGFLLPRATPAMEDLGRPLSCISGLTGDRSSSRPDSLSFGGAGCESCRLPCGFAPPVSPTISIQVALNAHLPAPADGMSESLRIAHHPVRLGVASGLLRLLRFDCAARPISRLP
jgi:hypothetical protein